MTTPNPERTREVSEAALAAFGVICGRKGFDLRSLPDEFQEEILFELTEAINKHTIADRKRLDWLEKLSGDIDVVSHDELTGKETNSLTLCIEYPQLSDDGSESFREIVDAAMGDNAVPPNTRADKHGDKERVDLDALTEKIILHGWRAHSMHQHRFDALRGLLQAELSTPPSSTDGKTEGRV